MVDSLVSGSGGDDIPTCMEEVYRLIVVAEGQDPSKVSSMWKPSKTGLVLVVCKNKAASGVKSAWVSSPEGKAEFEKYGQASFRTLAE